MQSRSSPWYDFVQSLPRTTNSPVLWSSEEQSELLQGSPALPEAQARAQALSAEWDSIHQQLQADPSQHSDSEAYTAPANAHTPITMMIILTIIMNNSSNNHMIMITRAHTNNCYK